MKSKQEIRKDVDVMTKNLHRPELYKYYSGGRAEALEENVKMLLKYGEDTDMWDEFCWGSDESVLYVAMYVAVKIGSEANDRIKDVESFYNFVKEWFKTHAEYYRSLEDKFGDGCLDSKMGADCAKEIIKILKNEKDEIIDGSADGTNNQDSE